MIQVISISEEKCTIFNKTILGCLIIITKNKPVTHTEAVKILGHHSAHSTRLRSLKKSINGTLLEQQQQWCSARGSYICGLTIKLRYF